MQQKRIEAFWNLVEEVTAYDTIHTLKQKGASEEEIKAELRRRHGLNALQASQALREYAKEQKEAKKPLKRRQVTNPSWGTEERF